MTYLSYWRRHRVVATAVVVTMALGVGAATAVFAVVEAVIVRALPVGNPDRLVWMWNARVERDRAPFSAPDLADYREHNEVLEGLAPFINWTANLTGRGDAERLEGVRVEPTFFNLLGVEPILGRTFVGPDERAQVTVLTERLWRRRFASDPAIVGQTISLNGTAHTVVGVLPPGFVFPFRDAEIAIPLTIENDPRRADRGAGFLRVVARLKAGVSIDEAKANLDGIGARLRKDYPLTNAKKLGVNLYPLDREIVGDARALLLTLFGAVGLLLLVACANIANVLLVALTSRRRELSLRSAFGAPRWRIGGELFGEIALLVVLGGGAGLFIARILTQVLVWWGGTSLPRLEDLGLTSGVVAFALGATGIAALVCGVMPAFLFSGASMITLADDGRSTIGSAVQGRFRRLFVALQVAAALTLLVSTLITTRSFARLQAVDPGFDGQHVLSVQLSLPPFKYGKPAEIITFADKLQADVMKVSGVREAAAISLMPLSGLLSTQDYRVVGQPEPSPDEVPQAHYRITTPGYFHVMGVGLEGREFDDYDRDNTNRVAIVSHTLAERHWPDRSALGEHIVVGRDSLEVVGVCDDVKQFGLDAGTTADLYVPLRQMPATQAQFVAARMYWVLKTIDDPLTEAEAVRVVVRGVDKDVATSSTRSMPQIVTASIGSRRFNADVIKIAGAASVLLALIGVYAVTAFAIDRRTREIGIRLALGARRSQVIRAVLRIEWTAIAFGLAAGVAAATVVSEILSSTLFASRGVEPAMIAGAAAMLGVAAVVASYVPARRAARRNPLETLRSE
jgi:putative ABC transport system permease protein